MNPMSISTSSASWKSGDGVSDQFPAGLRVLVVDDDPTCLRILEKMLRICLYEVTKCSRAEVALKLLRDNKDGFDVVISDVHIPDMDGFKLLEHIGLETDLPVIMMSADDSKNVVLKGVTHGACDYLIKPVRMEALKNIWQHVVRKKKHEWKEKDYEQSGSVEDGERLQKPSEDVDYSTLKKPLFSWSVELHRQFLTAFNQLGIDKATPMKILEIMNVPGLTIENVTSHLKKYRLHLKLSGQHQNGLRNSFMGPLDATFGPMSLLKGLEVQSVASTEKLVVWSVELHQQFVTAVNQLGIDKAVPKRILELMDVPGLTRENVATHLQKYRLYLKRLNGQHQNGLGNSFMGPSDLTFGPMSSLNDLKVQAVPSTAKLDIWSVELHQQFVTVVNQLGIDKAYPRKILQLMNVPGLTRENVAIHLEKYRIYLKRLSGQHQNGLGNSFMGHADATTGPIQAAALGRATNKSAICKPTVDRRNILNVESPKIRFAEGQQHSNNKQVNLLDSDLHINMPIHSQTSQSISVFIFIPKLVRHNLFIFIGFFFFLFVFWITG